MTKVKLCGLSSPCDIEAANEQRPEYIGFVFAKESRRYVSPERASELKQKLAHEIKSVGVFVNQSVEIVADLLHQGIIDIAQLHGNEDEAYIKNLRRLIDKPIIKAFPIETPEDSAKAEQSTADYILLDSGAGTGSVFDWRLIQNIKREYFLAGGLDVDNVGSAIEALHPYAVDVSSGIETCGFKDKLKMAAFVAAVRKEDGI